MTPLVVLHSAQSRLCSYLLVKRQDARYVPLRRGERKGRYSGSHLDIMKVNRRLRYQRSQAVLVVRHVLDKRALSTGPAVGGGGSDLDDLRIKRARHINCE